MPLVLGGFLVATPRTAPRRGYSYGYGKHAARDYLCERTHARSERLVAGLRETRDSTTAARVRYERALSDLRFAEDAERRARIFKRGAYQVSSADDLRAESGEAESQYGDDQGAALELPSSPFASSAATRQELFGADPGLPPEPLGADGGGGGRWWSQPRGATPRGLWSSSLREPPPPAASSTAAASSKAALAHTKRTERGGSGGAGGVWDRLHQPSWLRRFGARFEGERVAVDLADRDLTDDGRRCVKSVRDLA